MKIDTEKRAKQLDNNFIIPNEVVGLVVLQGYNPIKAWRTHLNLTQDEVAGTMGISQSTYAQMEASKKPTKRALERAASGLGIKFAEMDFI